LKECTIQGALYEYGYWRKTLTNPEEFIESRAEIEDILINESMGFLSMAKNNVPYTIPVTYGYNNGKILFHCSLKGKKLEYITKNPKVCFTVGRQYGKFVPHPQGAVCHANSDCVICHGTARIIEDIEERCKVLNIFNKCIVPDAREIKVEEVKNCNAVEIIIAEMTGRKESDSQCSYLIYRFPDE
jgi:nitroimidazol reductase NimA-like FMN-containing flavoprotein (pyridoxamine 5'-phosphate oxidase superfamily)